MGSLPQLSVLKGSSKGVPQGQVQHLFENNVDRMYGQNIATKYEDLSVGEERQMSYNFLNSFTNRLATSIVKEIRTLRGVANQDGDFVIAVCMAPSDYLVAALLAIWKAGAAYLPLDVTFPLNRIEHIVRESKPVLVIHDDDFDNAEAFGETASMSFGKLRKLSSDSSNANLDINETLSKTSSDQLIAIILYTSGSTGVPKGVRLPHSIIMNRLQWQWDRFPYSSTETHGIFKTALTFVDHVSEVWGPLLHGMSLVCVPREVTKNPEMLIPLLEKFEIERLVLVPTLLRGILVYLSFRDDKTRHPLKALKLFVCSGEILCLNLASEFFDHFPEGEHLLANFYGSTEVMGDVTYFVCENKKQLHELPKIPIGYPVDNTVIYILDAEMRPVNMGEIGEIYVSGSNLAAGYVNKRDPDRFVENPLAFDQKYNRLYKTGDFASIQKNAIYYEGRTDSQIKIRGYRVDLSEIEKTVAKLTTVEKAIVLCYHAGEADQSLLAFVKLRDDVKHSINEFQVESKLQSLLPGYMVPQVIIMDTIPLLVNGKIDRQSLLKSYESTNNNEDSSIYVDKDYTGVPESQMSIAKDLFEIVGNAIGRAVRGAIGVKSNFYELGGNSLNSILTVAQLKERGHFVSITQFISAANLGEILNVIAKNGEKNYLSLVDDEFQRQLTISPLRTEEKDVDIGIISDSFYEKAELEQFARPRINRGDYRDAFDPIWHVLVEEGLSFVVKNTHNETVGICLNFDVHNEPPAELSEGLSNVFELLDSIERPIIDNQLPSGANKVLHNFMMGTSKDLSAQENVAVISLMEHENINLAKRRRFEMVFTTNTSPLTQQLGTSVYGYKTLTSFQVNQFVASNGSRPFSEAPDDMLAICQFKAV